MDTELISMRGLLESYRWYYEEELTNKAYVVETIDNSLGELIEHMLKKNR